MAAIPSPSALAGRAAGVTTIVKISWDFSAYFLATTKYFDTQQ
jgi:hypothetical protein